MAPRRVVIPSGPSQPGVKSSPGKVAIDQRKILADFMKRIGSNAGMQETDETQAVSPPEQGLMVKPKRKRRVSSMGVVTGPSQANPAI